MTATASMPANDDLPISVVVTLETPLARGDQLLDAITLRRTDLGGLRGLSLVQLGQMNVDEVRKLLPRITSEGLIELEVDRIDSADMMQIAIELGAFLTSGDAGDSTAVETSGGRNLLVSVPLGKPIVRGDTVLTSITLRRPDSGALRGVSLALLGQISVDEMLKILPRITLESLTAQEAAAIDMADGMTIGGEIGDFLLLKRHRAA